jgi:hypothetical protein
MEHELGSANPEVHVLSKSQEPKPDLISLEW